jgi:hypothetical protein
MVVDCPVPQESQTPPRVVKHVLAKVCENVFEVKILQKGP